MRLRLRLYRTWLQTRGYRDNAAWASCIWATEKLLTPMWRTMPRSTNSSIARMVSAMGTLWLGE